MTTQTAYVQTGESESDCFSGGSFSIPSDGIDTAAVPSCHSYPQLSAAAHQLSVFPVSSHR